MPKAKTKRTPPTKVKRGTYARPTPENIIKAIALTEGIVGRPTFIYRGQLNAAHERTYLHISEAPNGVTVNVLYKAGAKRT